MFTALPDWAARARDYQDNWWRAAQLRQPPANRAVIAEAYRAAIDELITITSRVTRRSGGRNILLEHREYVIHDQQQLRSLPQIVAALHHLATTRAVPLTDTDALTLAARWLARHTDDALRGDHDIPRNPTQIDIQLTNRFPTHLRDLVNLADHPRSLANTIWRQQLVQEHRLHPNTDFGEAGALAIDN